MEGDAGFAASHYLSYKRMCVLFCILDSNFSWRFPSCSISCGNYPVFRFNLKETNMRPICSVITKSAKGLTAEKGTYFLLDVMDDEEKDRFIFDFRVFNKKENKKVGVYIVERKDKDKSIADLKLGEEKKVFWFNSTKVKEQLNFYYKWLQKTLETGF